MTGVSHPKEDEMGASVSSIFLLLSKEFTRLVIVAILISIPVGYLAMNRWLDNFAYHINLSWTIFAGAGLAALLISWLTVSYQSLKASTANPVDALRYE